MGTSSSIFTGFGGRVSCAHEILLRSQDLRKIYLKCSGTMHHARSRIQNRNRCFEGPESREVAGLDPSPLAPTMVPRRPPPSCPRPAAVSSVPPAGADRALDLGLTSALEGLHVSWLQSGFFEVARRGKASRLSRLTSSHKDAFVPSHSRPEMGKLGPQEPTKTNCWWHIQVGSLSHVVA